MVFVEVLEARDLLKLTTPFQKSQRSLQYARHMLHLDSSRFHTCIKAVVKEQHRQHCYRW